MDKFNVEGLTSADDLIGDEATSDEATSDEATSDEATSDEVQNEKGKGKKGKGKKATPPTTPPRENSHPQPKSDGAQKQVAPEHNTTPQKLVMPKLTDAGWVVH